MSRLLRILLFVSISVSMLGGAAVSQSTLKSLEALKYVKADKWSIV